MYIFTYTYTYTHTHTCMYIQVRWGVATLGEEDEMSIHQGTVWGWLPAEESEYFQGEPEDKAGKPGPLWRVTFSDDIMPADLDERELEQALQQYRQKEKAATTKKRSRAAKEEDLDVKSSFTAADDETIAAPPAGAATQDARQDKLNLKPCAQCKKNRKGANHCISKGHAALKAESVEEEAESVEEEEQGEAVEGERHGAAKKGEEMRKKGQELNATLGAMEQDRAELAAATQRRDQLQQENTRLALKLEKQVKETQRKIQEAATARKLEREKARKLAAVQTLLQRTQFKLDDTRQVRAADRM
jgi:hypothetical protein